MAELSDKRMLSGSQVDVDFYNTPPRLVSEGRFIASMGANFTSSSPIVSIETICPGVARIKMEDKVNKNTLSDKLIHELSEAFLVVQKNIEIKVVVLTGYDSYFSCGGTKEKLLAINEGRSKFTDTDVYSIAMECEIPVIAAMQGHGIGAGWSLGMFCDFIVMSEESIYTSNYMKYGFTPGAGATLIFPEKFGIGLAQEILFTGKRYKGKDLKIKGIPFPVLPRQDVVPYGIKLAEELAESPRESLIILKNHMLRTIKGKITTVYAEEVNMHEQTFVNNRKVKEKIQSLFESSDISNNTNIGVEGKILHKQDNAGCGGSLLPVEVISINSVTNIRSFLKAFQYIGSELDEFNRKDARTAESLNGTDEKFLDRMYGRTKLVQLRVKTGSYGHLEVLAVGKGEPVVFIPGFGCTAQIWIQQYIALSKRYQVIVIHLPGHGCSTHFKSLSLMGVTQQIYEALFNLKIKMPINLIGHSMGSVFAQAFAGYYPDKLSTLTVVGAVSKCRISGLDKNRHTKESSVKFFSKKINEDFENVQLAQKNEKSAIGKEDYYALIKNEYYYKNQNILLALVDALYDESTLALLPHITAPSLIMSGLQDAYVNLNEAKIICKELCHVQYNEINEAGHYPFVTHHEMFNKKLLEHLDQHQ